RRQRELITFARTTGQLGDANIRQLIAEAHVRATVRGQLVARVSSGIRKGVLPGTAGALLKLFTSTSAARAHTISLQVYGSNAVASRATSTAPTSTIRIGIQYVVRQAACIAGGTSEIQRNNVSERLLQMPRELSYDRDVPFCKVLHGSKAEHKPGHIESKEMS